MLGIKHVCFISATYSPLQNTQSNHHLSVCSYGAGEIQRTDYRVHSANQTCTFKDTGACSCAGARQLLLWPKEVVLSQPKKLTLKDALLVLQHFSRKLQLLSSQAAAADPGDQLGAYVKLQPCAAFITAALSNLAEAAAGQKRKAGAAAEAVSTPR